MSLTDTAQVFASIFAGVGLLYTAVQIRSSVKQRRAQHLSDFYKTFWSDSDILEAYYLIEYSEFEYSEDFHQSEEEKKIDKLLEAFSSIAKIHLAGLISTRDIGLLHYEYLMVYQNPEIQSYFRFLDIWSKQRGLQKAPYTEFRQVGRILEEKYYKS